MKTDRIIFFETFPVGDRWQKLGMEGTVSEGEDITEAYGKAKKTIEEAFDKINPNHGVVHRTIDTLSGYMGGQQYDTMKAEEDFEALKLHLGTFNNKQSALTYLETSSFKYSVEAKKFINEKFIEDGQ